jgi:predicted aconitase
LNARHLSGSIDLIHPELSRADAQLNSAGRRLMEAHLALGCESTFTCAPYQLRNRPTFGEQIAWAESNAIVFANSVLGARTNRYGDFVDLCAALTGRVPAAGLHVTENRLGRMHFRLPDVTSLPIDREIYFALIGLIVGDKTGSAIPVLSGLPKDTTEDELKALGAASASTGAVAMFHGVGVTPEAHTLEMAFGGKAPEAQFDVTTADIMDVLHHLNAAGEGQALAGVCLGTPHFSITEFEALQNVLDARPGPLQCDFYVNTSRFVLGELAQAGKLLPIESRGIKIVADTCTYITPILRKLTGVVMTNSGKWAHYAPANIGVRAIYASMADCVASAIKGEITFNG